ncbi:MAG: glycosyltransferase family 9 protein [Desulfovibrio sp.]|jgi:heptosyltransferase-2|nr:glycosyltransferase family 9 protein [Desulfovibrio sp.]
MKRIAVWNTAFLGDAVLTLPLLQSLRLRYPEAEIDYYVRGGLAPLFAAHPDISAVIGFDKRRADSGAAALFRLGRSLARRAYSLWISPHTSPRSAVAALASGAPLRLGYSAPCYNRLAYTRTVDRRFGQLEEIERILRLLQPLGPGPLSSWPEIALPPAAHARAREIFQLLDPDRPVLGLHPGSIWASKRWPPAHFSAFAALALDHDIQILLFAGRGEEEALAGAILKGVRGLRRRLREPDLHDLSARLSLTELAACLARLDCFLGNDSGPMHLAWCLRTPVAALFGPTVRAFGFTPRGPGDIILESDVPCRPCGRHGHARCPRKHHLCMTGILPETVWEAVRPLLRLRRGGGEARAGQRTR